MKKASCNCNDFFNLKTISLVLFGIAVGLMITYPIAGSHPVKWSLSILALALIIHFYPMVIKK